MTEELAMSDEVKPAPDERYGLAVPPVENAEQPAPFDPRFAYLTPLPAISWRSIAALVLSTLIFCVDLLLLAIDPKLTGMKWVVFNYQVTLMGLLHFPPLVAGVILAALGLSPRPRHRSIAWFAVIHTFAVFFFGSALYWLNR
jgi:hypothetical protein